MNDAGGRSSPSAEQEDAPTREVHASDGVDAAAPADPDSAERTEASETSAETSAAREASAGGAGAGEASPVDAAATADGHAEAASEAVGEDGGAGAGQETKPPPRPRRRRKRSFWRELPILVAVALLLAVVIKAYALQAFFIPSGSMENTLEINDRVLINKLVYDFRGIHRGDIVVFNGNGSWDPGPVPSNSNVFSEFVDNLGSMFGLGRPGAIYVKRVIGLPGDHVACCDAQGRVTVNGVPLNEQSYLYPGDMPSLVRFSIIVGAGELWVMGDHRFVSDDSRGHLGDPGGGAVPQSAVLGRAFIIIWPPSRWRILPIPATFSQPALSKHASAAAGPAGSDSAEVAGILGARLEPAGPALPLSLGFAGALPLTWLQRRIRLRAASRRGRETP